MKRLASLAAIVAVLGAGVVVADATAAPSAPQTSAVSVPITGTATNALGQAVNFAGTFALQRFPVVDGQLAAVGTLTGTLTNTVTGATQTVNQTVTLPVSPNGTCQILHLTLGPLDLNLLGLMVHLDRVVLDITAQSGPGNLLGNLLCSIAHLLDRNRPLTGVAAQLNKLIRIANLLSNIPVTATGANGVTFRGTFDVQRFVVSNGKLALTGLLNGTLTKADGTTAAVTNELVTLPLAANGTCKILHLELGPLDLNLLGLMVHLDKVVLDITAQSGPGNL